MNTQQESRPCALILAAGNGRRMRSQKPKALCEVLFKPMICWIRDWCLRAGIEELCVVIPPDGEEIFAHFSENTAFAVQSERRGTGHAVMQARDFLQAHAGGDVLVLNGDAPFIDDDTIMGALALHRRERAAITVVTAEVEDPTGYGRIVRSRRNVSAIVEHADADDAVRAIHEINSGSFWFQTDFLLSALGGLQCDNAQGEYYLTDTVKAAARAGQRVCAYCSENRDIVLGANDRRGLLRLNDIARQRVFDRLLEGGVSLLSTEGLLVSPDAQIGPDTTLYPGVVIKGRTVIGRGCTITSGSVIEDSILGDDVMVNASQIRLSSVGDGATIGPFSQLRPDSHLAAGVKLGDFVEIKNSSIGERTSVAHLTYIGDSDVGARCNFGCGVAIANYDGQKKSRCLIGDDVFIGCNTNLVAPVTLEDGAYTAAGSTITDDVPEDALAIARARQSIKPGWSAGFRGSKKK